MMSPRQRQMFAFMRMVRTYPLDPAERALIREGIDRDFDTARTLERAGLQPLMDPYSTPTEANGG